MGQQSLSAISHPNFNSSEGNKVHKKGKNVCNMPREEAQPEAGDIFFSYSKYASRWSRPAKYTALQHLQLSMHFFNQKMIVWSNLLWNPGNYLTLINSLSFKFHTIHQFHILTQQDCGCTRHLVYPFNNYLLCAYCVRNSAMYQINTHTHAHTQF